MSNIYNLTDTWNAAGVTFTAIKMNVTDTASAAGSRLIDLQMAGSSRLYLDKSGALFVSGPITASSLSLSSALALSSGGTGATTAAGARVSILPALATNGGKVLAVNAGATDVEWITLTGGGSVSSVNAAGGSTGLTFSGGPITGSGTLTLGGVLALASGGTGAITPAAARVNLLPIYTSNAGKVLTVNALGTDVEWSVPATGASAGANSDITSLGGITGGISSPDFIQFDTTAVVTPAAGRLYFNDGEGGLSYVLKGGNVVQEVGQSQQVLVYNGTGATISKGQVVYSNGAQGQRPTVALALATADSTSARTLGIAAENIANGAEGWVTTLGIVENINTSAFTAGAQLYLSGTVAGGLTSTKPVAPIHMVYVARCIKSHASAGRMFVTVQNGYEMDELHDVSAVSPANNDGLFYNTATSLWEKKSIVTALGYTPYNATNPAGYTTNIGTVTSVTGSGTVSGLTLSGTGTGAVTLTLGGTLSLTSANVTSGLGYTPATRSTNAFPNSPNASLGSLDLRTMSNPTAGLGYAGGGRFRFSSLNDDNLTPYADVIDLSTYTDASGGGFNSLYFGKNSQLIQHKYAAAAATSWTVKTLAYTDSNITGSAATLTTARTINGTSFNGSANITTASWGTARTITIGSTGKSVDGSANVSWTVGEIGATTVGANLFGLANPSAVTFLRVNADNTVSTLDAAAFRTAIGAGTGSGSGTVTSVSVVSANGFAGTVATATATPAITISTSISGLLKGNGTAISAAAAGTDYVVPSGSITGSSGFVAGGDLGTGDLNSIISTASSGDLRYHRYQSAATNKPIAIDNANGVLTLVSHPTGGTGVYGKQVAFANSDDLYIRSFSNGGFATWRKIWHDGNLTNLNQLTNGPGYTTNAGTVTSVSVVSANGFTGTVATNSTTPAITLTTSISGLLKGNGTAISAAVAGTDYVIPSGSITGNAGTATTLQTARLINGVSFNGSANITITDGSTRFQSVSDFADGTLVTTDIPANVVNGNSFIIEITGKSYSSSVPPFKVIAQGYLYNDTIISFSGINYGGAFSSYIKVFEDGGVLKFWWPRISYWNSFNVNVMSMDSATNGNTTRNRVTAIANSTEPTGTKKVQINLATTWNSTNFTPSTYLPLVGGTMTGAITFAAGQTWPTFNQNTTGSAATLTTARLINGVSFNGSADITVADSTKLPLAGGTLTGALTTAAAAGLGNGNPRSLITGYSGGNYGQTGYGIAFTTTSDLHNYAINDAVSLWEAFDGLRVRAAAGGTVGTAITWTTVLDARRTMTSMTFKGNAVLDASNFSSYALPLTGGTMTGAISFAAGQTWPTFNQNTTGSAATLTTARTLTIGSTGKTFNGSANVSWSHAELGTVRNFGVVEVQGVAGSNVSCTTAQFITWLTNLGAFAQTASVMKCSWSYAGNNDISDTGFGALDTAGCVIETFTDGGQIIVRVTSPSTGAGAGGIHEYIDHGPSYSPGWRRVYTSTLNGNITGTASNITGTYGGTLTSSQVTTALGFTPYNATNPSGYTSNAGTVTSVSVASANGFAGTVATNSTTPAITISTSISGLLKGNGTAISAATAGTDYVIPSGSITGSAGSLSANSNYMVDRGTVTQANVDTATLNGFYLQSNPSDSQGILVFNSGGSLGPLQMTFTYGGLLQFRNKTDSATWTAWKTALTSANFSSYAPTLTGGGASGTWAINISGTAATATSADQIDGVGFRNTGSNQSTNADTIESNGITYYGSGVPSWPGSVTDGALYSQAYSASWQHQIAGDYRTGQIALRGKNNGTWQSWRTVLDTTNFSTYAAAASHTHSISAITDATRWWNNFGDNHGTRTSFDTGTMSVGYGWRYVQGSLNGPGVNGATQYYSVYTGLGNDYPATGTSSYGMQIAFPRNVTTPYITIRYNENNSLGAWQKISAGYADSAGSAPTLSALGNYVWSQSTLPNSYPLGIQSSFVGPGGTEGSWQSYGSVMTMRTYSGGGGSLQLYVPYGPNNGGIGLQARFGNYDVSSGNSWTSWKTLLASDNFGSYAVPLSGGTMTGNLIIGSGGGINSSSLNASGNNGYGGTNYHGFLSVRNTGASNPNKHFRINPSGAFEIVNSAYTLVLFTFDDAGNFTAANNVTAYSDVRLKKDIVKIDNAIEKVSKLNGYTYTRTDTEARQMGVIAQEVMEVIPEVVIGSEDTNYSVAYGNMVALLIEAVKEQQVQINELKDKLSRALGE